MIERIANFCFDHWKLLLSTLALCVVVVITIFALKSDNAPVTTENTTTPVSVAEQITESLNADEIAVLKARLLISENNTLTLVNYINAHNHPVYIAPDLTGFATKSGLSALDGKMELSFRVLDEYKTAFNRANLYSGSLIIIQDDLAALKARIALSENVTAVHIADNTSHK